MYVCVCVCVCVCMYVYTYVYIYIYSTYADVCAYTARPALCDTLPSKRDDRPAGCRRCRSGSRGMRPSATSVCGLKLLVLGP